MNSMKKRILIVEDEPNMVLGLKDNLEFEGYTVETAEDGESGLALASRGDFDLILLDIMLPKMSGYDVCKSLRKEGRNTPVIFLSAKGEEIDKVLGLELGADDYLTKPFGLRELIARIKAVLRRKGTGAAAPSKVTIGKLTFDFETYQAWEQDKEIKLSHKEYEIMKFLWKNKNQIISRDDILTEVWGYDYVPTTRTIDNFILKLRQKLEANPNSPKFILTVHGIGYKLII